MTSQLNHKIEIICKVGLSYLGLNKTFEKKYGLSLVQWYTLLAIQDRPGCSAKDLAAALGVHPSTLTQTIKRLEKRNLISVLNHPKDSRKKRITLNIKGYDQMKKMESLNQQINEILSDYLKQLSF